MSKNELLTVQQFADAAGISKQAVYKSINNQLKPFVQLVDGKKMLQHKALQEIYGIAVDQPLNNRVNPLNLTLQMLQNELEVKNKQIADQAEQLRAKDEQIRNLTSSIDHLTFSLDAAQALHSGTMKQLAAPEESVEADIIIDAEETSERPKRRFFDFFRRNKE